jgi:hypothetical protein
MAEEPAMTVASNLDETKVAALLPLEAPHWEWP